MRPPVALALLAITAAAITALVERVAGALDLWSILAVAAIAPLAALHARARTHHDGILAGALAGAGAAAGAHWLPAAPLVALALAAAALLCARDGGNAPLIHLGGPALALAAAWAEPAIGLAALLALLLLHAGERPLPRRIGREELPQSLALATAALVLLLLPESAIGLPRSWRAGLLAAGIAGQLVLAHAIRRAWATKSVRRILAGAAAAAPAASLFALVALLKPTGIAENVPLTLAIGVAAIGAGAILTLTILGLAMTLARPGPASASALAVGLASILAMAAGGAAAWIMLIPWAMTTGGMLHRTSAEIATWRSERSNRA